MVKHVPMILTKQIILLISLLYPVKFHVDLQLKTTLVLSLLIKNTTQLVGYTETNLEVENDAMFLARDCEAYLLITMGY